jgi:hypothetical protein
LLGFVPGELLCLGSTNGASALASTALDASVSVDLVLLSALFDCVNGAFGLASATGNASVGNLVSHVHVPPNQNCEPCCFFIVAYFCKKATTFQEKVEINFKQI